MSVAVAVLDRDDPSACTDNIAVVDAGNALVTSIPRDLWCECLQARINAAHARGGAALLMAALLEHGYRVEGVLLLFRAAVENALREVQVEVPVDLPLRFLYPRVPRARLEDGAKEVRFDPPSEWLSGERLHQWLGARRVPNGAGSDLDRIRRQQVLVRRLLEDGFDFHSVLADEQLHRWTGPKIARDELAQVRSDWFFEVFDDVVPKNIAGQSVLVSRRGPRYSVLRTPLQGQRRRLLDGLARRLLLKAAIPGAGFGRPSRRVRLLAVLAVRNEARFLPGWFESVLPHVDGVIALDDGSSDGTLDLLASRPEVLELIRIPVSRPKWDEVGNHRLLVAAALRHGADWILALDADERPERDFRARAERVIRRGSLLGIEAYALRLLELWGSEETYRVDGPWGRKIVARLFRARHDHRFDARALHGIKAPLQASWGGRFPVADLRLYHLRMIAADDRANRRLRYETLDPESQYQPGLGYAYLTDDTGLKLEKVPRSRGYR
jgi:hypothetical protein